MTDNRWLWILLGLLILGGGGIAVYTMTRGLRNNNPGNIRYSAANNWQGQTGQDDAGFSIFDTAQNGIRALAVVLKNYQNKYGLNTVQDIISRWAPSSENDTAAYISDVADRMGVAPNAALNLNDDDTLTALVNAIIHHENGLNPYDVATVESGVMSA